MRQAIDTLGGHMLAATATTYREGACSVASVVYHRNGATVDMLGREGQLLATAEHRRARSLSPRKLVDRTVEMLAGAVWMTGADARISWKR